MGPVKFNKRNGEITSVTFNLCCGAQSRVAAMYLAIECERFCVATSVGRWAPGENQVYVAWLHYGHYQQRFAHRDIVEMTRTAIQKAREQMPEASIQRWRAKQESRIIDALETLPEGDAIHLVRATGTKRFVVRRENWETNEVTRHDGATARDVLAKLTTELIAEDSC